MTTTDTQVPAWLNLDAFGIDPDDTVTIRDAIAIIEPAIETIRQAADRAHPAVVRVAALISITTRGNADDEILGIVGRYSGSTQLIEILYSLADIVEDYEKERLDLLDDSLREQLEEIRRPLREDLAKKREAWRSFTVEEIDDAVESINKDLGK